MGGVVCLVTLLTACSSTNNYSEAEIKTQYEISFLETITPLKEFFSNKSSDNQTKTKLLLTLSQAD